MIDAILTVLDQVPPGLTAGSGLKPGSHLDGYPPSVPPGLTAGSGLKP